MLHQVDRCFIVSDGVTKHLDVSKLLNVFVSLESLESFEHLADPDV